VEVQPATSVDEVFDVLARAAGQRDSLGPDGDPIDVLAHSLQCADVLAGRAPDDDELQIAGLVHDLGHVLAPGCAAEHGEIAGGYVEPLLGPRVARLVVLHVPAKRYLVTTEPAYARSLSDGSTLSLTLQGGALDARERELLEREPCLGDALVLRRADEAAKIIGKEVDGLGRWRRVVDDFVRRTS
jgi:predicted HD phosphohydrolase